MFNFFKKNKDKESERDTAVAEQELPWGVPSNRKLSKKEEAAEAAEAAAVERRNRERRDMYRLPGTEQTITDATGRRFALRVEDNTGPKAVAGHPPLTLVVFWGAHELAHINAEMQESAIKVLTYKTERGHEGWGLPVQLLREAEKLARSKGAREMCFPVLTNQPDWDISLFNQSGFQPRGEELVKPL